MNKYIINSSFYHHHQLHLFLLPIQCSLIFQQLHILQLTL